LYLHRIVYSSSGKHFEGARVTAYMIFSGGVNCHDSRFVAAFTSEEKAAECVAAFPKSAADDRWAIEEIELDEAAA